MIRVADNGSGIPDDMKSHIFEMFYTEKVQLPTAAEALGSVLPYANRS
ncbi:MAG: hypothetical protein ACLTTN_12555 [Coprococcus eutactus]